MKLFSSILLAFFLSADAFVIQTTNPSSSSLKDVGLQWGYDEKGNKKEYYLEPWYARNDNNFRQNNWAYDPWGGISQTLHGSTEVVEEIQQFASADIYNSGSASMNAQAPPPSQKAAPLPPSKPAQPMPAPKVAAPKEAELFRSLPPKF